ncbi:hypothetical protein [Lacimicrobium sp. SS2-24]|uniref:hypothetical protein n=1 Tax=Lacimicrobium sp. SS2-24 TaxID=2005569 RepID=UPI0014392739|nr:hypothetical protein [Lacimicrobium sp. SS2-24]
MKLNQLAKLTGILLLIQLVAGIYVNFSLIPLLGTSLDALTPQLVTAISGLSVISIVGLSAINLIIIIINFDTFARQLPKLYLSALSISIIAVTLTSVEAAQLSEFTSLISAWVESSNHQPTQLDLQFRQLLSEGRNEAHYLAIEISSISLLFFYAMLHLGTAIPRPLVSFALLACSLQIIAIGFSFFEASIPVLLQLPLFITQIILPFYLVFRGFGLRPAASPVNA